MSIDFTIWLAAWTGFIMVMIGWGHYLTTIPRDTVPRVPMTMFVTQSAGLILGIASLMVASSVGEIPSGLIVIAGFAMFMAAFFFVLYSQRKTPIGKLQVQTGAPILAFKSMDSSGAAMSSDDWRGRRVLIKFFRGCW